MKSLPQVDKVLRNPAILALERELRRDCLVYLVRQVLEEYRQKIYLGKESSALSGETLDEATIVSDVVELARTLRVGSLQRVINGTGIILSTNLGRAPLPRAMTENVAALLTGYSSLEINLENGQRGERAAGVERLLCILTGCEAAVIVNNNAAAVLLAMNALSTGKEVIVSRGELIEIGGSFRLPDVIVAGGAFLKEVGTTNRTRLADYKKAVSEKTGLLLKCHRSNFEISGYTEETSSLELKELSVETGIPFVEDLGSGALLDLEMIGLKHEPTVQESLKAADLVMFSGDKLLGGSQAGIIVGKRELVKQMRSHPTYRALRLDKLNIALLELLLAEYLRPDVWERLPVYQMASVSESSLQARAKALCEKINDRVSFCTSEPVAVNSAFGGGTTPNQTIASTGLKLSIDTVSGAPSRLTVNQFGTLLRRHTPSIISLTSRDVVIINLRTVAEDEESQILQALIRIDESLRQ